jgi:chromosomal replication initiation ATPase DnaA
MDSEMRDSDQKIIKFEYDRNLSNNDFFVSKSNKHVFNFLDNWPNWNKKFLNIIGEKFSGKTHLVNIFLKKYNGIKFDSKLFKDEDLKKVKIFENIVLENFDEHIDEMLIYTLINIIEQDNKFLVITSKKPVVNINFKLDDLKSRLKNFLLQNIEQPDDELIFAIIIKNLSDRQISMDKKFIDYIIKRVDRSYSKIFDFIYKIDEISLKKKKSIDFKIIKEVLGE